MATGTRNIPVSVHRRLLNKATETSRPFNELLQHFAIERFIYRLSRTGHADRFILKGALMFSTWRGLGSRPTMDIDLLGRIDNRLEVIEAAMKDACRVNFEADGISFDPETVVAARITEDALYEGVRVRLSGRLGNARIALQIDIGFGDVIVPGPSKIVYPALLDHPAPELTGYTMESTIAEKFQAMVKLGVLNSRMKDFYDIWVLSRRFDFEGELLATAIARTFEKRNTPITLEAEIFAPGFGQQENKKTQWRAFLSKSRLADAPDAFDEIVTGIRQFLAPIADSLSKQAPFPNSWIAPGPWVKVI